MSYRYPTEREKIFTDEGQQTFLKIRDNVHELLGKAGAVMMGWAIYGTSGESFLLMACVDRLVELGEIQELTLPDGKDVGGGQHRVFVRAKL